MDRKSNEGFVQQKALWFFEHHLLAEDGITLALTTLNVFILLICAVAFRKSNQ